MQHSVIAYEAQTELFLRILLGDHRIISSEARAEAARAAMKIAVPDFSSVEPECEARLAALELDGVALSEI
jgi:hypothetical protein